MICWFLLRVCRTLYDQVANNVMFMICYWSVHCMLRSTLWFVTGQNTVRYDQVYDLLLVSTLYVTTILVYDLLLVRTLYVMTKFMICYWSEFVCYWPSLMICYWSEHYVTTKFMICYWSERCMLRPSWWFVTGQNAMCNDQVWAFVAGQNAICYDQAYDLLLVRTLYVTISNSYIYHWLLCFWPSLICYWSVHCMLRPSWWFVIRTLMLRLVSTLYVTTKFMICCWSERCMLRPSLWFVTGQNAVCYDQVYDLLLVRTLYATTKFMICYWSDPVCYDQDDFSSHFSHQVYWLTGQKSDMLRPSFICYWSDHICG